MREIFDSLGPKRFLDVSLTDTVVFPHIMVESAVMGERDRGTFQYARCTARPGRQLSENRMQDHQQRGGDDGSPKRCAAGDGSAEVGADDDGNHNVECRPSSEDAPASEA